MAIPPDLQLKKILIADPGELPDMALHHSAFLQGGAMRERRLRERLRGGCAAMVRGTDAHGHVFEEHTRVHNFSASGLCVDISRAVEAGQELFVAFALSINQNQDDHTGARFATHGTVRRVQALSARSFNIGIEFHRHSFNSRRAGL